MNEATPTVVVRTAGDACDGCALPVKTQTWCGVGNAFTDELTSGTVEVLATAAATQAEHAVGHDHLSAVETRRAAAAPSVDVGSQHQQINTD